MNCDKLTDQKLEQFVLLQKLSISAPFYTAIRKYQLSAYMLVMDQREVYFSNIPKIFIK